MNKDPSPLPNEPSAAAHEPASPAYPSVEELGALLPQYEIVRIIAIGGMGAVYLARQISLDRWVAIKVLPVSAAESPGDTQRFITEARAMARLVHPHIVAVFDFGQTIDGHLYLVMEFVEGDDLHRRTRSGEITLERARQIVIQLCDALQFAHNHGVAHRDIKPANVLINKDWQVKVADFGLARELTAASNPDEPEYGTPDYTAPERLVAGAEVDHRADIYALGVVMHEMLTGQTPRSAGADAGKNLPEGFAGVISKCLMHDPERRFQSAAEVKAALLAALRAVNSDKLQTADVATGSHRTAPAPIRRRPQLSPWKRVMRILGPIGWGIASVALLAGLVFIVLQNTEKPAPVVAETRTATPVEPAETPDSTPTPSPQPEAPMAEPQPAKVPAVVTAPVTPTPTPMPAAPAPAAPAPVPAVVEVAKPIVNPPATPLGKPYAVPDGAPGEVARLQGHTATVSAARILPDQRRVVTVSNDRTLRIWDTADGRILLQTDPGIGELSAAKVSPDGERALVLSAVTDKLALVDLNNGRTLAEAAAPNNRLYRATFLPDGKSILVSTTLKEGGLFVWKPDQGAEMMQVEACPGYAYDAVVLSPEKLLLASAEPVAPDSERVRFTGMVLSLPDLQTATPVAEWTMLGSDLRLSSNGARVTVSGTSLSIYDVAEMRRVMRVPPVNNQGISLAVPIDGGRLVLTAWPDRTLRILEAETGEEVHRQESHARLFGLDVSQDERWAVTSCGAISTNDPQEGKDDVVLWRLPKLKDLVSDKTLQTEAEKNLPNLPSIDAELAGLRSELEVLLKGLTSPAQATADLTAKYVAAVRREAQRMAPREQRVLFAEADMIAVGSPLPAAGTDVSLPPQLQRLRSIYREQLAQLERQTTEARTKVVEQINSRLTSLMEQRKQSGDRQGAARAAAVLRTLLPETSPLATSTTAGANTNPGSAPPPGTSVKRPTRLCSIIALQRVALNTPAPTQPAVVGSIPGDIGAVVALTGGRSHAFVLLPDGKVRGWGTWSGTSQTVTVPDEVTDVVQIASSSEAALALRADGQVVAWGPTSPSRLWQPPAGKAAMDLCAGNEASSYVLCTDGTIHPTGATPVGQPPDLGPVARMVYSPDVGFVAILRDMTAATWQTTPPVTPLPNGMRNIVQLSLSPRYAVALQRDGTLVGWGQLAPYQSFRTRRFTGVLAVLPDPAARVFPIHRADHGWELVPNPSCNESVAEDRAAVIESRLRSCIDAVFTDEFVIAIKPN